MEKKKFKITEKSGLILEGGGMRGVFTCGVLDCLMDRGIRFPYTIGVSAGACNGLSYMSHQRGRAKYADIDLLKEYDIHKGDLFFLPAGRIHSIGAGAFIAEIQQTSNITYRIYDFNRVDANGNPRELHTEQSKAVIDYSVLPDYRTYYDAQPDKATQLVSCRYFTTDIYRLTKKYEMPLAQLDSFVILICTAGKGTITDNSGETINIHQGESILVPATTTGLTICPEGEMELLGSWIEE